MVEQQVIGELAPAEFATGISPRRRAGAGSLPRRAAAACQTCRGPISPKRRCGDRREVPAQVRAVAPCRHSRRAPSCDELRQLLCVRQLRLASSVCAQAAGPVRLDWQQAQRSVEPDAMACGQAPGQPCAGGQRRRRVAGRAQARQNGVNTLNGSAALVLISQGSTSRWSLKLSARRRDRAAQTSRPCRWRVRRHHSGDSRIRSWHWPRSPAWASTCRQRRGKCAARCRAWRDRRRGRQGCDTATSARRHPAAGCRDCLHRRHRPRARVGPSRWQPTARDCRRGADRRETRR